MGIFAEVKQRAKTSKKRKGLLGVRRQIVNNVNTGINLSTVNNESKKDNLNIMIKVVVPLQQQRLLQVMKRFLFLKHPQYLHLKWKI